MSRSTQALSELHPSCQIHGQDDLLKQKKVRTAHSFEQSRFGYRAVAFNEDGGLSELCYPILNPRFQEKNCSVMVLPDKGFVLQLKWGGVYRGGVCYASFREVPGDSNSPLVSEAIEVDAASGKKIDNRAKKLFELAEAKHKWLKEFLGQETYDPSFIPGIKFEDYEGVKRVRRAAETFRINTGISLDRVVLDKTLFLNTLSQPFPDMTALRYDIENPVQEQEGGRSTLTVFYGRYHGTTGEGSSIEIPVHYFDDGGDLSEYHEVVAVTTVSHNGVKAFYQVNVYSRTPARREVRGQNKPQTHERKGNRRASHQDFGTPVIPANSTAWTS